MPSNTDSAIRRWLLCKRAVLLGLWVFGLLGVVVVSVWAAVTIAGFEVEAGEEEINAYWETASEITNLGFYIWRSESRDGGYVKLPLDTPEQQFIPSEDFGMGAFYEFVDVEVTPGILYYYKVQDVPANGTAGELIGPESAMIDAETATPEPDTETPTATPTPVPGATSTPFPDPTVRFWTDKPSLDAGECATLQWQTENVQAVFFNGTPVTGQGAQTYCPCETQTYTLSVTYLDGTAEDFAVQLSVSGTCQDPGPTRTLSASVLATPTPPPSPAPETPTPIPASATPQSTTTAPASTVRPSSTPRTTQDSVIASPQAISPLGTPSAQPGLSEAPAVASADGLTLSPDANDDQLGGLVVEGVTASRRLSPVLFIVTGLLGMGLLAGGVWLWRRG